MQKLRVAFLSYEETKDPEEEEPVPGPPVQLSGLNDEVSTHMLREPCLPAEPLLTRLFLIHFAG